MKTDGGSRAVTATQGDDEPRYDFISRSSHDATLRRRRRHRHDCRLLTGRHTCKADACSSAANALSLFDVEILCLSGECQG